MAALTFLIVIATNTATANAAAIPKPAPRPTPASQTPQEIDRDSILEYLKNQYPNVDIPESAEVVWVESTGRGAEADIEEALRHGSIMTRRYPQAPDPFQAAGDFGGGRKEEDGNWEADVDIADRELRDAQLARHWLDVRENLSIREIDRKALDLVEEFSKAKHAVEPISLQGHNGALSYVYGDHIPRILCRPNHLTNIALQAGEKVTAVHAGDTARWQISPARSGPDGQETVHVIIKPLMPDIRTNLLIMTDRRTYNLDLLSSVNDFIPAVRFSYPDDVLNSWNTFIAEARKKKDSEVVLADAYSLSPDSLYFGYEISTKNKTLPWKPVRVFDDGMKTYIEMPARYKSLEAPVLMFYEGKQLKLVNYRVKDRYYIVDRVMTGRAVLMAGQSRVVIERRGLAPKGF
ncbi:MAG: P-type conjugative transfer protein TrbG [Synergistaceae bacterium]|nr:P-type conjugative transfer protein TrbG [Synergistaceae bacterium]